MRQIDADKLKEELELKYKIEYENNYKRKSSPDNDGKLRLDVVEKVIDDAPTVNEWIPVEEALPPIEEPYFVGNDVLVTAQYPNGDRQLAVSWRCGNYWNSPYGYSYPVIAWMPLPEPYEGEKKNEKN